MKIVKIFCNAVLLLVFAGCIFVELYLHGSFQFLEPLDTVHSMTELTMYVEDKLEQGKQKFEVYTVGITEKQIKQCNRTLDGFLGNVDKYILLAEKKNGMKRVRILLQLSDNYYVKAALDGNKKMLDRSPKARELYDEVQKIKAAILQPSMSDYKIEKAVHDYIVKNSEYCTTAAENEQAYKAYGVLLEKKGVCSGYAEAMYLLLYAGGVECKMISGTADGQEHAWNLVKLEKQWYQVDVAWDDPTPDQKGYVQYNYFNLTDEIMGKSHNWNKKAYPQCTSPKYNYYVYNHKICNDYATFQQKVTRAINHRKKSFSVLVPNYDKQEYKMDFVREEHSAVTKATYLVTKCEMGTIITLNVEYEQGGNL